LSYNSISNYSSLSDIKTWVAITTATSTTTTTTTTVFLTSVTKVIQAIVKPQQQLQ
jgi:hypothetical protein